MDSIDALPPELVDTVRGAYESARDPLATRWDDLDDDLRQVILRTAARTACAAIEHVATSRPARGKQRAPVHYEALHAALTLKEPVP